MTRPDLNEIGAARQAIAGQVIATPVLPLTSARWDGILPDCAGVSLKLELFQQAGSFKARGAYLGISNLPEAGRADGDDLLRPTPRHAVLDDQLDRARQELSCILSRRRT